MMPQQLPWRYSGHDLMGGRQAMNELGKVLLGLGLMLAAVGALLLAANRIGLPLGRLPGDLAFRGKHVSVFLPLGTCLLISAVLSLVLYLLSRHHR